MRSSAGGTSIFPGRDDRSGPRCRRVDGHRRHHHPEGAPIFLAYGSANRDPRQFTDPDELDLERRDNQHLGFGQGIHFCFGAPLARLEVQNAVGEFVRRVENPRLVEDPPPYRRSQIFRGPRHVLVDIDGIRD
ncbi:cytochrome P450 [Streptomyces virginiae]|uniref:cytochrome P450 n=1 Tax=Streptomyces virginiae TaxID=1961 RepID=UPI00364F20D3